MVGRVLDLLGLSLKACLVCGNVVDDAEQGFFCLSCLGSIKPERIRVDRVPLSRAFGSYRGVLEEVLRVVKFRGNLPLARRLGRIVSEDLRSYTGEVSPDVITYVPVHPLRLWKRGFDQNREILRGAGLSFTDVLVRVRYSKPLASLKAEERKRVVRGAFKVRTDIEGRRVLVFDDVVTTGSTALAVRETLLRAGAKNVLFYFLAVER